MNIGTMNYKVKSLLYLFVFILCAALYHQMEQDRELKPGGKATELTLEEGAKDSGPDPAM